MANPKITYLDATGALVTLNFTYPPVTKPIWDELAVDRVDQVSSSGKQQSCVDGSHRLRTLAMDSSIA